LRRMSNDPEPRPRVLVAPLVPLAMAVAAGIAVDRYADPWGTVGWAWVTLAGMAVVLWQRFRCTPWVYAGLLAAAAGLGGGWHHERWSNLAPNDLALGVSEAAQPAWVRGVLRDVPGVRPGDGPVSSATTRAVLDVTSICDGRTWRSASGCAQLV